MQDSEQLLDILRRYSSGISYVPVHEEPNPLKLFPELATKIVHTIQPVPSLIPADEANRALKLVQGSAFILIPGRTFDARGTRHGKGAGWYDRFLSTVPADWLRVGFCYNEQFSKEPLTRQEWDEPMDYVCAVHKDSGILTLWQSLRSVS